MSIASDERCAFLSGQVHALISFALATVETHPNKAALKHEFEMSSQVALARLENALTIDKAIEGFQDAAGRLLAQLNKK